MATYKVVITDWEFEDLRYEEQVLHHPDVEIAAFQCRTEEEVIKACQGADAIINQYAPITRKVIESLEKCQVITRYGIGLNTIDLDAATEKGICVANAPDYGIDEVSNHALALLMNVARKITFANQDVKQGKWDFKPLQPIYRLTGLTLGLVGFGNIAQRLAEKVVPLGLNVIAYDPYIPEEVAKSRNVALVSLNELCQNADLISVHAPLLPSTKGMIGKEQFQLMKKGVSIINTSRGPVIDETAFIEALQDGIVAGAGLDVVEQEPIATDHPFLSMNNVVLTPHSAWYSEEAAVEVRSKTALGVMDVLVYGEYPKYLANRQVINKTNLHAHLPHERYNFDRDAILQKMKVANFTNK